MTASILITRPNPAGTMFADHLRTKLGKDCAICTSPLMQIEVCANLPDLAEIATLIFTSRHGVEAFAQQSDRRDIPAYAVGETTGNVARQLGLSVTAGDGDAERLIAKILHDNPPAPCLHVRGDHVAAPVAKILSDAGIETHEAVAYMQKPLHLSDAAQRLLHQSAPVILPLFSPRSAKLFFSQPGVTDWKATLYILAISASVADQVPSPWAKRLTIAKEPTASAMMQALQRLYSKVNRLEGS